MFFIIKFNQKIRKNTSTHRTKKKHRTTELLVQITMS